MRLLLSSFLLAASCLPLQAQTKAIPGFDVNAIDRKADPCNDFYQYACGTWMANNPIPSDQAVWGRFNELNERNREILRDVLERAAQPSANRSATDQKIGDYYASCMDEAGIEAKGLQPLKPTLDRIAGLKSKADLTAEVVRLHRAGVPVLFNFTSGQDFKNAKDVIAQADQGGLGLPERDYYLKTDPKSVELRQQYQQHAQKMLELAGLPDAAARAAAILRIETDLAKGSLDVTSRRNPEKLYHRMPVKGLVALSPSFNWSAYLASVGAPKVGDLNVAVPDFFKAMEQVVQANSLDDLKTYLAWHAIRDAAPLLPKAFADENFSFNGRILTGQKEQRARWKRCVAFVDGHLGEALGKAYVEKTFPPAAKRRMTELVAALEKALAKDIQQLEWMTPATKKEAMVKLNAISNKLGHPERFRDYDSVRIVRGDAVGNAERATTAEFVRQLDKIGRPVDPAEWFMTPPTVNAYYDPQMNNINFPAGILQPPFFDLSLDDAVNFGAIGAVIGHELTHGFDDEGRQFDAQGNLRDWWTAEDAKRFEERAECMVRQYGGYTAVADLKLNGKLTLGENTADNGGVRVSYMALMDSLAGKSRDKTDGFTPEQRFFLGYAQVWCQNITDQASRLRAQVDPHSPGKYRVNGVVSNMPEFQGAFGCKVGDAMVSRSACRVW